MRHGTKVRTHDVLEDTRGLLCGPGNLGARKPSTDGTIHGVVPGHGGDVYWIQHAHTVLLAPYCFTEFELATP